MADSVSCQFCGGEFRVDTSSRNWQHIKFCSDNCRKANEARKKRERYRPKVIAEKVCESCREAFVPASQIGARQKYCSRGCYLDARRLKAEAEWSRERRSRVCKNCGKDFLPKKYQGGRQIYCSKGCQVSAIAKRHDSRYRRSGKYQQEFRLLKPLILERDKRCVVCGSEDRLHVHHWDNSGRGSSCDNSPENLAVLCGVCHSAIHKVTLAKVDGEWCLDGKIFALLGLSGPIPVRDS